MIEAQVAKIGAKSHTAQDGISKLSVVGIGMRSHTGVAATLFQALAEAGINIQMISTSEIKISVIINEAEGAARDAGRARRVQAGELILAAKERFETSAKVPFSNSVILSEARRMVLFFQGS